MLLKITFPKKTEEHHAIGGWGKRDLSEKYGLKNLVEAFCAAKIENAQLWLFGSGDFQTEIQKYAATDARIKYFGRIPRNEILEYEKKATLLVNVRDDHDAFTKYSFPSKVITPWLSKFIT